jgi:hypothetical protein
VTVPFRGKSLGKSLVARVGFDGVREFGDCAINGETDKAATRRESTQFRFMRAFLQPVTPTRHLTKPPSRERMLPDEFDPGGIAAPPDHLAIMPGTGIAREGQPQCRG